MEASQPSAIYQSYRLPLDSHYSFTVDSYTIGDDVYFRLRDIAAIMQGSTCQFDVKEADSGNYSIQLHIPYTCIGGELSLKGERDSFDAGNICTVTCNDTGASIEGVLAQGECFVTLPQLSSLVGFNAVNSNHWKRWNLSTYTDRHVVIPGIVKFGDFNTVDKKPFGAVECFDRFWFVGEGNVGCFVIEYTNSAGEKKLVLLDALEWQWHFDDILVPAFEKLGLELADITDIINSHEHFDHWGIARDMQQTYGTKVYWSAIADDSAAEQWEEWERDGSNTDNKLHPPRCNEYLTDGLVLTFGETSITCVATPGHAEGCYSFIINVKDHGAPHTLCCWGGTGVPRSKKDLVDYVQSAEKFADLCASRHVDVELSIHPYCDYKIGLLPQLESLRAEGKNPLVCGKRNVQTFLMGVRAQALFDLATLE